ncbi:Uncharacterised protein [Chlamydia trachomatis]|nr:Uncharacterised protein [Chlamydia trachomatis]
MRDRNDRRVAERGRAVGASGNRLQVLGGNVVNEQFEDAGSERRIAFICEDSAEFFEVCRTQLRVAFRHVETTVGGEALQKNVAERARVVG